MFRNTLHGFCAIWIPCLSTQVIVYEGKKQDCSRIKSLSGLMQHNYSTVVIQQTNIRYIASDIDPLLDLKKS